MPDSRSISGFLLIVLLLASCQSQAPVAVSTSQTWQVTRDSNLNWLGTDMSDCLVNIPGTSLSLQEAPFSKVDDTQSDISLVWGNPQNIQENMFTLGWDEWVFISHPNNPVASITLSQARSILAGKTRTWNKLIPELNEKDEVPVELWVYPAADESQAWLRSTLGNNSTLPASAHIAPGTQAMLEAVSTNENAFGFLPSRWVTPSVKIVPISDLPDELLQQPIVARLQSPTLDQQAWLACLQTRLTASAVD